MDLTYADVAEYPADCVTYQTSQHTPPSLSGDQHVNYELIKDLMDGNYQTIEIIHIAWVVVSLLMTRSVLDNSSETKGALLGFEQTVQ